ncbi:hypothetical protein NKJ71_13600 [Mesorhizobium sp. M0050]|uniref:DUF7666 domain-containing protein n=1 Tax=Mesorhizobium sp. M0050 TaxID=2956861 RepID=UPI0033353485
MDRKSDKSVALATYKGFTRDLTCTPDGKKFQYEVGKTYDNGGKSVTRCGDGAFHSVEMPLDAWGYYGPATGRFASTTASGDIAKGDAGDDTKVASAVITINAELRLPDFIRKSVAWIIEAAKESVTAGYRAHAASTGYRAHAASTGYRAHAASTGNGAHAASTGDYAHAASTGYRAHAASTGYRAHAASTGDYAHAASTGDYAHAASTGDYAHAASTGYRAHAASTGNGAHAASTGNGAHAASTGNGAIAAALGAKSTATAVAGGGIVLAAYDESVWPYKLVALRASLVGQNGIEAGKSYRLTIDGKFEQVQS